MAPYNTHLYHSSDHKTLGQEVENHDTKAHSWIHLSKHDVEELSGRKFRYKLLFDAEMIPTGLWLES